MLNDTITRIVALDIEAAKLFAALDVHVANERDHAKAGALHRIRTCLLEFHQGIETALQSLAGAAKHSAAMKLGGLADELRTVIADASQGDANRARIEDGDRPRRKDSDGN
jgi:hypothetical protein